MAHRIFISYSRQDKAFLQDLIPQLREVFGYENVWFDADLYGGQEWWSAILGQIGQSDILLYCLSEHSNRSNYCRSELIEAFRLHKQILPVLCSRVRIPHELSHIQVIDMSDGVQLHTFAKLLGAIERMPLVAELPPPLISLPTPLPTPDTEELLPLPTSENTVSFEYDPKLSKLLDPAAEEVVRNLKTISRIRVKQFLRGGQSGSQVLLVDVDPLEGRITPIGPHYLKIHSDAEKTSTLLATLDSLQKTSIKSAMPTIADYVEHQGRLAVLYAPAQGGKLSARDVIALGDLLHQDMSAAIQNVIGLSALLKEWNRRPQIRTHEPLEIIIDILGKKRVTGDESVQKRVQQTLGISDESIKLLFGGRWLLPNPLAFLSRVALWGDRGSQSIVIPVGHTHGDLHANNLICLQRRSSSQGREQPFPDILDFATYKPEKLIFFDFAYLEFDLLIRVHSLENRDYREQVLEILPFIMSDDDFGLRESIPGKHIARSIPDLVRPLRQAVESFFGSREDFRIAYWLAAVAVGLNFARKRTQTVSHYDNLLGVLYAASALQNVLEYFGVKLDEEEVPSVKWLDR